ncbi:hypothetical protein [Microcella alkaliphila]|nr:hypothetical protein [Microcella alkaliphila]
MSGKSPRTSSAKKEAKLTIKEKRELKREKAQAAVVKPRKSR